MNATRPSSFVGQRRWDLSRALEVWGDMVILCLYYMWVWGVCLATEPWLHWAHYCGSPYLEKETGGEKVVWGLVMLALALLSFHPHLQRWFGILAVLLFCSIRAFDLATAKDPGLVLVGGCALIVILAFRGTIARIRRYG